MQRLENGAASAGMLWKGMDMAEKDMTEKALKAYNNVFADIVNCLLFHGEERIMEDDLEQGKRTDGRNCKDDGCRTHKRPDSIMRIHPGRNGGSGKYFIRKCIVH